jgi:hypothetical protein
MPRMARRNGRAADLHDRSVMRSCATRIGWDSPFRVERRRTSEPVDEAALVDDERSTALTATLDRAV